VDIPRKVKPSRRKYYLGAGLTVAAGLLSWGLSGLAPAAPAVERQSVLIDTVKRGAMVFQVRGTGTLVPVDVRMITAQVPCKVERILLYPGTRVTEESVIAELSSPELQQAAVDALWQTRRAEADYEIDRLNQRATLDSTRANAREASAILQAAQRLRKEGLQSDLDVLRAQVRADEITGRLAAEEARAGLFESRDGKVAPARARLEQARALYALKQEQVASLKVRAGMAGILQQVLVQVGQQLAAGASLAKVAKPMPLKAELRVSETQAKDILIGQPVDIDTRNGVVKGRVIRIDPAVQNGTVTVDASLEGELPRGARPDLSVEGVIELDRADHGLFVGRPVQAQAHGSISLFRLNPDGVEATRVRVRLGRGSVSSIEIVDGLKPGDQIVLSDTSAWDAADRIRLK
jgi:HlyD family secretion protein